MDRAASQLSNGVLMTINGQDLTTHHEFPVNLQGILEPPV